MTDGDRAIIALLEEMRDRAASGAPGGPGGPGGGGYDETTMGGENWEENQQKRIDAAKKIADNYAAAATSTQAQLLSQEQQVRALQTELNIKTQIAQKNNESADVIAKMTRELQSQIDMAQAEVEALGKMEEQSQKFNKQLAKASGYLGAMKKDAFKFADAFIVTPALNKFISVMKDVAFGLDKAEHAFERTTGLSEAFSSGIADTYKPLREYGVSVEDAATSHTQLARSMTDFTMLGRSQRQAIANTGALLAELGVSQESFAKNMQVSTKMFGQGATQAADTMIELKDTAKALGVAPAELADQFGRVSPQLAKLGSEGSQAFKDLARLSKITGMEIEKLVQITSKFDTFEEAATQAGKLNAALGTNSVNAMDLLMETDPAARFGTIRDAILDTGLTFDDMSYYQRQFYTDAMGLSEVGDLALALSGDMSVLGGAANQNTADYQKMAEQAKAVQSIQEKFNATMAAAAPVLNNLIDILHGFFKVLQNNEWIISLLVPAMIAFKVASAAVAFVNLMGLAPSFWAVRMAIFGVVGVLTTLVFWLFQKQVGSNFVQALKKMAVVLGGLAIGWGLVSGALNLSTTALKRFTLAMMANPIGLVLVAVTAGTVLAIKNWDKFVGGVQKGVSIMMIPLKALAAMLKKIVGLKDAIKSAPGKAWGMAKNFGKALIPGLANGGIVESATLAMVGEAGPEAVVPLDGHVLPVKIVGVDAKAMLPLMMPMLMMANPLMGLAGMAGGAISGLLGKGGGGGSKNQPLVIQLDGATTKAFLEGKAVDAVGKVAMGDLLGINAG
jgi:hypothetical protein